jgi:hypothetical protein
MLSRRTVLPLTMVAVPSLAFLAASLGCALYALTAVMHTGGRLEIVTTLPAFLTVGLCEVVILVLQSANWLLLVLAVGC